MEKLDSREHRTNALSVVGVSVEAGYVYGLSREPFISGVAYSTRILVASKVCAMSVRYVACHVAGEYRGRCFGT